MMLEREDETVSVDADLIGDAHDLSRREALADDDSRGPAEDDEAEDLYGEDLDDEDDDKDDNDDDNDDDDNDDDDL